MAIDTTQNLLDLSFIICSCSCLIMRKHSRRPGTELDMVKAEMKNVAEAPSFCAGVRVLEAQKEVDGRENLGT